MMVSRVIFYCNDMKVKVYELDVDVYEGGFSPMYRLIELEAPSVDDAVGFASKRMMESDSMEYMVVSGDDTRSPSPHYFTEKVMEKCEEVVIEINLTAE